MILDDILKILKTSNNKAYTVDNISYTYSDLYKYVCNIYEYLLKNNKDKKPVVVYGHKEIYMKASFLACSFAGMTYVPIDTITPEERINQIIQQVNPAVIIKDNILSIMQKDDFKDITEILLRPNDIYYIIFTSGSTGIPKGVKITYNNLNSCMNWLQKIIKIKKGVILNQANFAFDLSVADFYLSLLTESEHYIINDTLNIDFIKTFNDLKSSNVTLAVMTPSYADLLLLDKSFGKNLMPNLNTILFCGEKLLKSTVNKLKSRFDSLNIINSYGPTECTFAVTSIELDENILMYNEIPVGISKDDVCIYIVDENMNIKPEKEIGEILISGASVGDGYLNKIEDNSFLTFNGKKAYLTGDLGYIENNILYYIARKDTQIKYKGYRIELSDIEKNLQSISYVEKAVVVAKKNAENKITDLFAFVKLYEGKNISEFQIKKDLQCMIPSYMCPKIKIIKEFPINKNGKCDSKKLLEDI